MLAEHREFLRFGDSIYLHACAEIDLIKRSEEVDEYPKGYYCNLPGSDQAVGLLNGFLSAKGFMSPDVFFQKTNVPLSLNEVEMPNLLNSRDFRFVLVPALKYDFHQEYERALEELKKVQQLLQNIDSSELPNFIDSVKKFEDRVQSAQERAKKEVLHNKQIIKESLGKEILYGLDLQLMHQDSETFLNAKDECSETDKIGYKLELSRHFQQRMVFQLLPRFRSRQLGEKIQFGDLVHLLNVVSKQNLCISDTQFEPPFDLSANDDRPLLPQQNVVDPSCSRHVAYLGDGEYNIWKILVHSRWDTAARLGSKIYGHNLVRFYLADADAYLGSSVCFEGGAPEIYLRNYYGENTEEKTGLNSIWELTHFCKVYQGAEFQTDKTDRVLIRHFNSGKILAISKNNIPYLQDYGEYLRREAEQANVQAVPPVMHLAIPGILDHSVPAIPPSIQENRISRGLLPVSVGASPPNSSDSEKSSDEKRSRRKSEYVGLSADKHLNHSPKHALQDSSGEKDSFEEKIADGLGSAQRYQPSNSKKGGKGQKVALNIKQKMGTPVASPLGDPNQRTLPDRSKVAANLGGYGTPEHGSLQVDEMVAGASKNDRSNKEKLDQIFKRPQVRREGQRGNQADQLQHQNPGLSSSEVRATNPSKRSQSPPVIKRKIGASTQAMRNAQDLDEVHAFPLETPAVIEAEFEEMNIPDEGSADLEGGTEGLPAILPKAQRHKRNPTSTHRQPGDVVSVVPALLSPEHTRNSAQPKLRGNLSRLLRRDDSQNAADSPNKRLGLSKKTHVMSLKTLLPHQIALKDSFNTVVFSHFQKTTALEIADGNTINLHKSSGYKHTLKFLSACYRIQSVYDRITPVVGAEPQKPPAGVDESGYPNLSPTKPASLFNPIDEKYLQADYTAVAFMPGPISSALSVYKVKDSETRCYLKLRSVLEPLKKIAAAFKHSKGALITNSSLLKTQNIMKLVICFLYDVDLNKDTDYTSIETEPVRERQVAFKEIGMVDILMELIHYPFANEFYQIEHIQNPLYISRVLSLSYTAIRAGIREVRSNELYASQWLDMMISYAIKDKQNILKAKETLTELIDNNERILGSHLKEATVRKFVGEVTNSEFESKNVSILRALCVCNGKAVQKNQDIIRECLLEDRTNLRQLASELKLNDVGTVVMASPFRENSNKMVELKLLKEKSELYKSHRNYYIFYLNLIGLFSDVCLGRNYKAIDILKEWFSLDVVLEVIVNPVHPPKLRKEFVNLLDKLYLDVFPFQEMQIPYLVREFQNIKADALTMPCRDLDPLSLKSDQSAHASSLGDEEAHKANRVKFAKLVDFLMEFLDKGSVSFDDADEDLISFVEQVLKLITQLVKFGFFRTDTELRKIYFGLIRIMCPLWKGSVAEPQQNISANTATPTVSVSSRKFVKKSTTILDEELKSPSAELESFTELRKSLCEAIRVFLQVELDFQISKAIKIFKDEFSPKFESLNIMSDSLAVDSIIVGDSPGQKGMVADHIKKLFERIQQKVVNEPPIIISHKTQLVSMLIDNTLAEDNQLKKLSLALLKDLYSSSERIIKAMQQVLLIETEAELKVKTAAEKIHLMLFKLHEKMPSWYGKPHSPESFQLNGCIQSLTKLMEEFQAIKLNGDGFSFVDDVPKMGPELEMLCNRYLFINSSVLKSFRSANSFFSEVMQSTGISGELLKILEYMISNLHVVPKHQLQQNKILTNSVILALSQLVQMSNSNKQAIKNKIYHLIETCTLYGENGQVVIKETVKHMFSTKTFTADQNTLNSGQLYNTPAHRIRNRSHMKFSSPNSKEPSRPGVEPSLKLLFSQEGENPYFGGLSVLTFCFLKGNKSIISDKQQSEKIAIQILDYLSNEGAHDPNYFMAAYYCHMLEQLVYLRKHAVKSTQNFILRQLVERSKQGALSRFQTPVLWKTLVEDLSCQAVASQLNDSKVLIQNPRLCFSLGFISVLSACSFERNEYGEKIAQSIIPPHVLLQVLRVGTAVPDAEASPSRGHFAREAQLAFFRNRGAGLEPVRNLLLELELVKFMLFSYFETEISYDTQQMETNIELMMALNTNLFKTIKENLVEDAVLKNTVYVTHKELIEHSRLFLDYSEVAFELFKEFFVTVLTHSNRDLSALKAEAHSITDLINLIVLECHYCISQSKIPRLTEILKSFLDDLAGRLLSTNIFEISDEAGKILQAANPIALGVIQPRKLVQYLNEVADSRTEKDPQDPPSPIPSVAQEKKLKSAGAESEGGGGGVGSHNNMRDSKASSNNSLRVFSRSNKFSQPRALWKLSISDLVRKGFEAIALEDYYEVEVDREFQSLVYKGQDESLASSFNGFLVGLMKYVKSEPTTVTDQVMSIFFNIIQSFLLTSKAEELQGNTLKSKQAFMLKHQLIDLIFEAIIERRNPQVIFDSLECAITLMSECNTQVQLAMIEKLRQHSSHLIFTKLIGIVDDYLEAVEKSMTKLNSEALMTLLLGSSSDDEVKSDEQARISEKAKKVELFFDFMRRLCEGHNSEAQDFLRNQNLAPKHHSKPDVIVLGAVQDTFVDFLGAQEAQININLIRYSAEVFQSITKYLNRDSMSLCQSVVDFMIEAVQGPCEGNQKTLLEQEIFLACKDVLADLHQSNYTNLKMRGLHMADPQTSNMIGILLKNVVGLLMALIEGNDSGELIEELGSIIEFQLLMDPLTYQFRNYFAVNYQFKPQQLQHLKVEEIMRKIKTPVFSDSISDCLEIFLFVRTINESSNRYQKKVKNLKGIAKSAFEFYMNNTSHIEINFRNKTTKIYFVKHPACRYLSLDVQNELMNSVNRENPNQKVADFVNSAQSMFNRMEFLQLLITRYRLNPQYLKQCRKLSLFICGLLNLYLFVLSEFDVVNNIDRDDSAQYSGQIVLILAWLYIFTNSVSLFFYAVENVFLKVVNAWSKWIFELKYLKDISPVERIWLAHMMEKNSFELTADDYKQLITFKWLNEGSNPRFPGLIKLAYDIKFVGGEFWMQLFFTICTLMGIVTGDKWFYCFPLLDMLNMSSTLMALIQAVTLNGDQILLAVALVVVIIFLFTLYAYYYVLDTFWNSSFGAAGENQCTSVRHCFFTIFSLGPRSSGSIGDMLLRMSYATDNLPKWYSRYIFDLAIFVIVNVLGMNIIFGIIIQTFAAIREQLNFQNQDKENVCFACSLSKNEIEKTLKGFEYHTQVDHNVWNYLYFIYYLKKKPADTHTGPHSEVRDKISKDDIFWFPFGKCLALSSATDSENTDLSVKLADMKQTLAKLDQAATKVPEGQEAAPTDRQQTDRNAPSTIRELGLPDDPAPQLLGVLPEEQPPN